MELSEPLGEGVGGGSIQKRLCRRGGHGSGRKTYASGVWAFAIERSRIVEEATVRGFRVLMGIAVGERRAQVAAESAFDQA